MEHELIVFEGSNIRRALHNNEWFFSVIDIVQTLSESKNARRYWSDLKIKLKEEEGFDELYEKIVQLKLEAPDGKMRETDCANAETLFRIIQSIENSTNLEKDVIGGNFYYKYAGFYNKDIPEFIKREILLEPGYRGGSYPTIKKEMNSFVAETILKSFNNQIPTELLEYKNDINCFSLQVLGTPKVYYHEFDSL